jgi:hypothetical protein
LTIYRKPPTISTGIIFFCKRWANTRGAYTGGWAYIRRFMVCMIFTNFSV